jgi:2-methylisocitrate lyase-like PEP mutase family enzyme
VAETVRLAAEAGLAGCSVEDYSGPDGDTIYDAGLAAERVAAASEAAKAAPGGFVLTARAENHVHGRDDLADTIKRLRSYEQAGADVLFAPGVRELSDIRELISSVNLPVNVLVLPGMPSVSELAEAGVSRISVGGAFAYTALGAAAAAGRELLDEGTYGYWETAAKGAQAAHEAFKA